MYLLLIFILLKSGGTEVRTSIVYGLEDDARQTCKESLPLTISLYERGRFHDGPPALMIKSVKGRCEPVLEDNKVASVPEPMPMCRTGDSCLTLGYK